MLRTRAQLKSAEVARLAAMSVEHRYATSERHAAACDAAASVASVMGGLQTQLSSTSRWRNYRGENMNALRPGDGSGAGTSYTDALFAGCMRVAPVAAAAQLGVCKRAGDVCGWRGDDGWWLRSSSL